MNLHGIVSSAISAINPMTTAVLTACTGYTPLGDGTQVPTYAAPVTVQIQAQATTEDDLQKLEGLNIQAETQSVWLNGSWSAVSRPEGKGGDLLTYNGANWLVEVVSEDWGTWSKLIVVRQI